MSQATVPQTALVPMTAPGLMGEFVRPLALGQRVTIREPLSRESMEILVAQTALSDDGELGQLKRQLQALARRLLPQELWLEILPAEMKLVAVAYQVCWFFHHSVEEGRVWQRRLQELVEGCDRVLSSVGLPRSQGQLIARHLLLRHLPQVYRTDTRLEFGAFWQPLEFLGTTPDWARWPLRSNPLQEKRQVWIHQHVYARPAGRLYYGVLSRSPLTNLLHCDRLHPQFTFWGAVSALALPDVCRLVTNDFLARGLHEVMPALAHGFGRFLEDEREPLSHRRYVARFLLNLGLSWCYFAPKEQLGIISGRDRYATAAEKLKAVGAATTRPRGVAEAPTPPRAELLDPRSFYPWFWALYRLRGPLGAAHLDSDGELRERVALFLAAAHLTEEEKRQAWQRATRGLGYTAQM